MKLAENQVAIADYRKFLERKSQLGGASGFKPIWMPEWLKDFQGCLLEWIIPKGRGAMCADCGMGKSPMQLVWSENVIRHTNRPVLVVAPLAVSSQTVREAEKFGIEAAVSRDGTVYPNITVTNYERLHYFDPNNFAGIACDESSGIKNFDAQRTATVTEFTRRIQFRSLWTATAAPNDFIELGTSSEVLGELGYMDMLHKFFKNDDKTLHLMGTKYGDLTQKNWRFKPHSEKPFWRWVCSFMRACRKPSDLGFDDGEFQLPPLTENTHVIHHDTPRPGMLFNLPAVTLNEQREERKATLVPRCERVAELVNHDRAAVIWCHLNQEGDLLERIVPDARQVCGSQSDDEKEELFLAFASGQLRKLITKPKIGGFGMNWQHCAHETFFPSHSFEQYYQCIRRCWRFGQTQPVTVDIVTSPGESAVQKNLKRKAAAADKMFTELVAMMNEATRIGASQYGDRITEVPSWL